NRVLIHLGSPTGAYAHRFVLAQPQVAGQESVYSGQMQRLAPSLLFCGDDRDRTGNLRLAKPALSQLSYVPCFIRYAASGQGQWAYLDSNQGPQLYQSCALAN